jgi:translocator protein
MNVSEAPMSSVSPVTAAALASASLIVPLAMSASASPSPNHPRIFVWYSLLKQPFFKPPDWLFPIAWTGIEAALAVSAHRLLRAAPSVARTRALSLWAINILLIGGWSRLFFGHRNLAQSTFAAVATVASGAALVSEAHKVDKTAGRAAVPLVAWVAFASILTASIWVLNSRTNKSGT